MKFFLDECVSPRIVATLAGIYKDHIFVSSTELDLRSTKDTELFPILAQHAFDAIITEDKNQLTTPTELQGLYDNGIRWMGYKSVHGVGGLPWIAMLTGTLVSGLVLALENWGDESRGFKFHHGGRQTRQHFTVFEVDTTHWRAKPVKLAA